MDLDMGSAAGEQQLNRTTAEQTDLERRERLLQDLDAVTAWDDLEQLHLRQTATWIRSGVPLERTAFDVPDPHLVAYFVVTDPDRQELLLGHHRKAGLLLPSGGHVEAGELPWRTVVREAQEELRLQAVALFDERPFFLTRAPTVGARSHTDVSLWFVLRTRRADVTWFDPGEYTAVEWLPWQQVLAEPIAALDPHMHRFTRKLIHH